MKRVIFSLCFSLFALYSNAQSNKPKDKDFKFSLGAVIGIPVGIYSSVASFTFGSELQTEYSVTKQAGITLNVGIIKFAGKNGYSISGALIPVMAGAKIYLKDNFYGSAQLGLSFSTEKNGGSAFTFSPGMGYKVSENFDLLVKYQAASKNGQTTSFFGIKASYIF